MSRPGRAFPAVPPASPCASPWGDGVSPRRPQESCLWIRGGIRGGGVLAFGRDEAGQLGDGTTTDSAVPVAVSANLARDQGLPAVPADRTAEDLTLFRRGVAVGLSQVRGLCPGSPYA